MNGALFNYSVSNCYARAGNKKKISNLIYTVVSKICFENLELCNQQHMVRNVRDATRHRYQDKRDWKLRDMTLKLLLNLFYRNLSRKFLICSDPGNGEKEIQSVHDQEIVRQRTICKPIRVKSRLRNDA